MTDATLHANTQTGSLAGHLLVATPVVADGCFARSVVYLCSHSKEGAMGMIINTPVTSLQIKEIYDQLDIEADLSSREFPIHFGGPVDSHRGFIVHSAEAASSDSIFMKDGIAVTASMNILMQLAEGKGPDQGMLVLGYAGWSAGQLEAEIETGSWIVIPASKHIVFNAQNDAKWNTAVSSLGFDMGHYSTQVGHA